MTSSSFEHINDLIETLNPQALDQLKTLESCAFQDINYRTPLNTAIAVNFTEAIEYLMKRKECLEFFPKIDADLKSPVKHSVSNLSGTTIYLENYLTTSFGDRISWERTPLLQACRYQNKNALELLIHAGAKLDVMDVLQKTGLEIGLDMGGQDAALTFLNICTSARKKCKVTDSLLLAAIASPDFYRALCEQTLDADAKRLVFNLACAYLDVGQVQNLLKQGFEVSKLFKNFSNPVLEACTSTLLHVHRLPDYTNLAHLFAREDITSDKQSDNLTAEDDYLALLDNEEQRENFFAGNKSWRKQIAQLYHRRRTPNVPQEELDRQLKLRLELVDVLFAAGATAELTEKFYTYYYPEFLFCTGEVSLLERLTSYGLSLHLGESEKADLIEELQKRNLPHIIDFIRNHTTKPKSETSVTKAIDDSPIFWELAGESVIYAKILPEQLEANKKFDVRLTHYNSYGPDKETVFYITAINDQQQQVSQAVRLNLIEDLIYSGNENEFVARKKTGSKKKSNDINETPWKATFETQLQLSQGKYTLQIKAESKIPEMNGVISDWQIDVD